MVSTLSRLRERMNFIISLTSAGNFFFKFGLLFDPCELIKMCRKKSIFKWAIIIQAQMSSSY